MYRLSVSQALSLLECFETVADVATAVEEGQIIISALPDLISIEAAGGHHGQHPLAQAEPIFGVLETLAFRITELGQDDAGMAHECEKIAASILGLRTDLADVFYEMKTGSIVIAKAINEQTTKIEDQTHKIEQVIIQNEARLDGLEAREAYPRRNVS